MKGISYILTATKKNEQKVQTFGTISLNRVEEYAESLRSEGYKVTIREEAHEYTTTV